MSPSPLAAPQAGSTPQPQVGSTPQPLAPQPLEPQPQLLQLCLWQSLQPQLSQLSQQRWHEKIRSSKQGRLHFSLHPHSCLQPQPWSQPQLGFSQPQVGAFASQPQVGAFASQPQVGALAVQVGL